MMRRRWSFLSVYSAALGLLAAAGAPVPAFVEPGDNGCLAASPPGCYTPQQFRTAYGIQPLLNRSIDGRGETVTVIVPYPGPGGSPPQVTDIRQDLAIFDGLFRLPPAHISVVTTLAGASAPWGAALEEVMDTEIVHAVAPGARLRVVLMPSSPQDPATATAAILAALPLAIRDTDVVSLSGGQGEHFFSPAQVAEMRRILREAAARHGTVVTASGDSGAVSDVFRYGTVPVPKVGLPAADPLVLSVGGTTLIPQTGFYIGETAWNQVHVGMPVASGGGFSGIFTRPAYQDGIPGTEATPGSARRGRRRRHGHGAGERSRRRKRRAAVGRRHQCRHPAMGRADGRCGPVRRPRPGLRQPGPFTRSPGAPCTAGLSTTSPRGTTRWS